MPLRSARVGRVGVIGHPDAKTAVVAKAFTPGPSPVAKAAVVAPVNEPQTRDTWCIEPGTHAWAPGGSEGGRGQASRRTHLVVR